MKRYYALFFFLFATYSFAQTEGYAVNADASQTYFRTFGSGTPILIINGGPGMNSNGFEAMARKLAKNHLTIIYDQRGTGKSALSVLDSSTINMKKMVADIEVLRKHLKIDKWSVLGHSFGGMLASYYATLHPEHIDKLILSSSGGVDLKLLNGPNLIDSHLSKAEKDSLRYWNNKIENGDTSHKARLGRGRAMAPAYVFDRKFIPIIAERLTQSNMTINSLVWNDLQKMQFDCKEELKSFKRPVLIIQGKQDIISNEIGELALHTFPNARLVLLEKCKHYGWLDAEYNYFGEIEGFLKD
ncbi:alpha/beta fold hydrolase [Flavobacterium humi]|uniref:Alpha/beta hydrolase n=1 Tax=Flavobacterium humi TaxID=2562683 RepID=A0A4Z0LB60_9FLAO|nr:alpha/beta hydrolase [Flavobacterium humi]TGD58475.1 alpha/beta hydrolase [Flavobacterium humi]